MSRPLENDSLDALESALADAKSDPARLTLLLHELSFRRDPASQGLKERAEEARLKLAVARARDETRPPRAPSPPAPPARPSSSEDFPGFNSMAMLDEMSAPSAARGSGPEDRWRASRPHLAMLALSTIGIAALTAAVLAGAFKPQNGALTASKTTRPIEVGVVPYAPPGGTLERAASAEPAMTPAANGVSPAKAAMPGSLPQLQAVERPQVQKLNLTTEIANLYAGEGAAIVRAAVAAAGLGLNETVRWRNDKTGRHGAVTLLAQDSKRANCYTARISRLDTGVAQYRTRQLCF